MSRRVSSLDLKIVVLGSLSVGKTSIINRYCNGIFKEETLSTIGAGFFTHTVKLTDTEVTLMVWDTAGEERFRSVAPSLLRGTNGLVLVYDITNAKSFNDIDLYMEMFLDTINLNPSSTLPVLLLGNKSDLENVEVSEEQVEDWKTRNNVEFGYRVSAKTGDGIDSAFDTLVKALVKPTRFSDEAPLVFPTNESTGSGICGC